LLCTLTDEIKIIKNRDFFLKDKNRFKRSKNYGRWTVVLFCFEIAFF